MRKALAGTFVAVCISTSAVAGAALPAHAVDVPQEVTAGLAGFAQDPAAAMNTWAPWAALAPKTSVRKGTKPTSRSNCRQDSVGIARCDDYAQVIGRGNRNMGMKKISEVVSVPGGVHYFRDVPLKSWVKTKQGADLNPITNGRELYGVNPFLPFGQEGVDVSTAVSPSGSYQITSTNTRARGEQPTVLVATVASDGRSATVVARDAKGKKVSSLVMTVTDVAAIPIPKGC